MDGTGIGMVDSTGGFPRYNPVRGRRREASQGSRRPSVPILAACAGAGQSRSRPQVKWHDLSVLISESKVEYMLLLSILALCRSLRASRKPYLCLG